MSKIRLQHLLDSIDRAEIRVETGAKKCTHVVISFPLDDLNYEEMVHLLDRLPPTAERNRGNIEVPYPVDAAYIQSRQEQVLNSWRDAVRHKVVARSPEKVALPSMEQKTPRQRWSPEKT